MSLLPQLAFNLLLNSACSFAAGLFIVSLSLWLFRVQTGRWKLFLLLLPFVKIVWDLCRGVPADSCLFTTINPLMLPPKHQTLTIGAGFSGWGPVFSVAFSSRAPSGVEYSTSFADYVWGWLARHFSAAIPAAALVGLLGVSVIMLLRRLFVIVRFEVSRRRSRDAAHSLGRRTLGNRCIDVYRSEDHQGAPFTGGWLAPYICLPSRTLAVFSEAEREAAIQHEVAHIRSWDLPLTLVIQTMGDLFWFIPGYRYLSRRIDRLREILADEVAVRSGASAAHLASALLKLKDIELAGADAAFYSALAREKSLIAIRVERLVGNNSESKRSRFFWSNRVARVLISFWISSAVMVATLGGNHALQTIPSWMEKLLRSWGLL